MSATAGRGETGLHQVQMTCNSSSARNDPCYVECTHFDRLSSGYHPVPATERPPPYTTLEAGESYQPGPSSIPLRPTASTVMSSRPHQVHVRVEPPPNDYLVVTIVMSLLCFLLGNWPGFVCLFPALIFSIIARTYKEAGHHDLAKRFGQTACTCNILSVVLAMVLLLVASCVIVLLYVFTTFV